LSDASGRRLVASNQLSKGFDARFDKRSDETPARSDILSDIASEKSADVGKHMKADEKITMVELAQSERLGKRS
jgi:hypothetical protein